MNRERLLRRFDAWEARTRGLRSKRYPVPIEPAYRPLLGKERIERGIIDDSRRPSFFDRFRPKTQKLVAPPRTRVLHLPIAVPAPPEPTAFELLPAADWNGSSGVQLALLESLSHAGHHLAFEIVGTPDRVTTQLVCDALDTPLIKSAFRAHAPDVRMRPARKPLLDLWTEEDRCGVIQSFGLENRVFHQLRTGGRGETDAFVELIGQVDDLEDGELAIVQVLFAPVRYSWQKDLEEFVSNIEDVDKTFPLLRKKFSEPVFAVVLRFATLARDEHTAVRRARRLASSLVSVTRSEANRLTFAPPPKHSFDEEVKCILARETMRPGMLLSLSELETLAHIPSAAVQSERYVRQGNRTKVAPSIAFDRGLILGVNEHEGDDRVVSLPNTGRLKHTYVIGASGTGKSTLLLSMAVQDIEAGNGFAILDPHGDLVDDVLARIPPGRERDVILFDPADEAFPIGFNILSAHSELEKTLLSSDLVAVFRRLSTSFGDQMVTVLGNAILAFLESSEGGTLLDLRHFFVDKAFRARFLETVEDPEVVHYWEREFPLLKGSPQAPLLTRLNTFLRPKLIRHMVAQQEDRLNFRAIMDGKKILLARLSHGAIGEENAYLLGSLLVAKMAQAAMSRQDEDATKRVPFFLYIDEFHHFVTPSIATILSGARKYGLGLVLAHQEMRQLKSRSEEITSAVLGNAYTRIVFRVGDQDAKTLADGLSFFKAKDLQNLGIGEAIVRIERPDFDFNLRTHQVPKLADAAAEARRQSVTARSRATYGKPRADVEAILAARHTDRESAELVVREQVVREPGPRVVPETSPHAKTEAPAKLPGRGGPQHKYLQDLIRQLAVDRGFEVSIEETVLDGHGYVDVALTRGELRVACEITITTRVAHELRNLSKCLAAGFSYAVLLSSDERVLATAAAEFIPPDDRVRFLTPDALISFLDGLTERPEKAGPTKKRGNQGKVPFEKPVDGTDQKRLLSTAEAAEYLGLAVQTLAKMRVSGESPPFYKLGRQVLYDRSELDDWVAARKRRSTSSVNSPSNKKDSP